MTEDYPHPASLLLTLGETQIVESRNYLKMGFTREHIPDLIRLVENRELSNLPWDERGNAPPQVYAQVHAWRTLTQLGALAAIPSFIGLLHYIDQDQDDFIGEEMPKMLGKLGAPAIDPCRKYLADRNHGTFARIAAGYALSESANSILRHGMRAYRLSCPRWKTINTTMRLSTRLLWITWRN